MKLDLERIKNQQIKFAEELDRIAGEYFVISENVENMSKKEIKSELENITMDLSAYSFQTTNMKKHMIKIIEDLYDDKNPTE